MDAALCREVYRRLAYDLGRFWEDNDSELHPSLQRPQTSTSTGLETHQGVRLTAYLAHIYA